jgi:hypothetical protein
MTLTIEVAPEEERALEAEAQRNGQTLDEFLRDLVKQKAAAARQTTIAARLAALEELAALVRSLPNHRAQAGLPPLDLSGPRGDVYGYTEREDAQL